MDLLEYQGKQLFARHNVPVPPGSYAADVDEALAAADEIGYPCVVKAQVQIGGRGKLGGIKPDIHFSLGPQWTTFNMALSAEEVVLRWTKAHSSVLCHCTSSGPVAG